MRLLALKRISAWQVPNLWSEEDMGAILQAGVVCIQRAGVDGVKLVNDHELFQRQKANIFIVPQRITNTISSASLLASFLSFAAADSHSLDGRRKFATTFRTACLRNTCCQIE